jgi:hypothetical protein
MDRTLATIDPTTLPAGSCWLCAHEMIEGSAAPDYDYDLGDLQGAPAMERAYEICRDLGISGEVHQVVSDDESRRIGIVGPDGWECRR